MIFLNKIFLFGGLSGTVNGFTPLTPGTDNDLNITAMSANAAGNDLAHELGHQFQLKHVEVPAWVLLLPPNVVADVVVRTAQNLMCGGLAICTTHASDDVTPEQVQKARQEAKALE